MAFGSDIRGSAPGMSFFTNPPYLAIAPWANVGRWEFIFGLIPLCCNVRIQVRERSNALIPDGLRPLATVTARNCDFCSSRFSGHFVSEQIGLASDGRHRPTEWEWMCASPVAIN